MRHIITILFCLLGLLLFAACAHYPLNMSEAEWNRLTPEQQFEARKQQAALDRERDIDREKLRLEREARESEAARLQYERDVADGMIRKFDDEVCIGGSRCPGDGNEHIYSLGRFAFVDKIVLTAHDNVGNKHGATIDIHADRKAVAENVDIKRQGSTQTFFVGEIARNIIIRIHNDDEVVIKELKVFGEILNASKARILIQSHPPNQ